jgi:DNA-directed RNA polymerase subunit omega
MARITVEDCMVTINNMYELVHAATRRSRQLYKGADPLVRSKNRVIVTALREIAAGKVKTDMTGNSTNVGLSNPVETATIQHH